MTFCSLWRQKSRASGAAARTTPGPGPDGASGPAALPGGRTGVAARLRCVGACETSRLVPEPSAQRIASYLADPEKVGRVLLLYSGGLDTSVMLHWIQAQYGAEIVTLTVNLGQPDEDWDVVTGKARDMGAIDTIVVDAREEFASEYVLPAIRANGDYGDGYPLFTALARPLIGKLAVEHARAAGCDTIAHGCTGKGNDQVRLEATIATLDSELRILAPV